MKNESNANNGPQIGPTNPHAFNVDVWKGAGRSAFYLSVIYLALVYGGLSAAQPADSAAQSSWIIALLFLPFIYVYSVPFEVSKKEHFPTIGKKRYMTGPYAALFWLAVGLTLPFVIGLCLSLYKGLLPAQAYPICILGPYAACQIFYASRYRLLQIQRSPTTSVQDKTVPRGVVLSPLFLVPHVLLILLTAIAMTPSIFYEDRSWLEVSAVAAVAFPLTVLSLGLIYLGDLASRNSNSKKRFLFENPFAREPLVLLSALILPFLLGRASAFRALGVPSPYAWAKFDWPGIFTLVSICAVGWVFELFRYIADYSAYASRLGLSGEDLHERFRKSVTHYNYIYEFVICLMPLLLFIGGAGVGHVCVVAFFVCILTVLGAGFFRPYPEMGFDGGRGTKVFWLQPPVALVGFKVLGYYAVLLLPLLPYALPLDSVPNFPIRDAALMALCAIPLTVVIGLVNTRIIQYSDNSYSFHWPLLIAVLFPFVIVSTCFVAVALSYNLQPSDLPAKATMSFWSKLLYRAQFELGAVGLSWSYLFVAVFVTASIGRVRRAFDAPGEQLRADLFSNLPCRDILSVAEKHGRDARTTANGVTQLEPPIGPGEQL